MPLYGDQTWKAIENFPISGWTISKDVIHTLACIKEHAAVINGELGEIPKAYAQAIVKAAQQVQTGKHDDQFPVDVFQTGSGTSTNMNVNEVIARLASTKSRSVHPNDHVNCGQSSNDAFPSAVQIACAQNVREGLLPSLKTLQRVLLRKSKQFHSVIKTGRTHLMDAVPIRFGDEFAAYAALVEKAQRSLEHTLKEICILPLGGTAVGTGINAHPQFGKRVIARLKKATKLPLKPAKNCMASQSCPLAVLELSSALREVSVVLNKIATDIAWMSSGPVAGLSELHLPDLQAGSSIMPGKVNPVLCESVQQVALYCTGADATVQAALQQRSVFELNTALPVIAQSLLVPIRLLSNCINVFTERCLKGIKVNKKIVQSCLSRNPMLVTALAKEIGYDRAAEIATESLETGETIYDIACEKTGISEKALRELLDIEGMV